MRSLRILSCGGAHPKRMVTNDDLAKNVDTSDEWITTRTGIKSRYFCSEGETANSMAIEAASQALKRSGVDPAEIGCIVTATISGDYATPSISCMIQKELGMPKEIPVLDVSAACSGFIYALEVARGLLESTGGRYALVTGCEQLSKLLDMTDRSTCVLFGDGAGSCLVEAFEDEQSEQKKFVTSLGAKGDMAITAEGVGTAKTRIQMDGKEVFRFAVSTIPKCIQDVLEKSNQVIDEIDWIVCHQANARIIEHCIKKMKAPAEKFYMNLDHYGNTSGASIPMALNEMYEQGLLIPGQNLILVGFGAGLTWGGAFLTYKGVDR
jgi:3-oxoacyl-[acyl-carrier-protein] synthase-3